MGFLDNSTVTVDAILTKRGREILASGGDLNITKFALSDEEIDYTLWDVTHPNGTDSYGAVIENMSLLEATPTRTSFRSFLTDVSQAGAQLNVGGESNYTAVDKNTQIDITPNTIGGPAGENYIFTIENTNVIKFIGAMGAKTQTATSTSLMTQAINLTATSTLTIQGLLSGLVQVVSINVAADNTSTLDPDAQESIG